MVRIASLGCLLTVVAFAHGQSLKDRFLNDYGKAVAVQESRLTRNIELTITGKEFDESGQVTAWGESTFRSNDTCMLVKDVTGPGNYVNWYLLRPEGSYRISPSATNADEYVLRKFTPFSEPVRPSKAGAPFFGPVYPLMRVTTPLYDHIASNEVTVLGDEINGSFRGLKVREKFDSAVRLTTFRFRLKDLLLDEILPDDNPSVRPRVKFYYVDRDGESFPSRLERFQGKPDGTAWLTGVVEFSPYRRASFPDSEFSLARFGLPEAVNADSPPRRTPLYVWLLVAAATSAGAACLVRFIARRRKAMARWLGVTALLLLLAAGVAYLTFQREAGGEGLVVEQPVRDIGSCTVGEVVYLKFSVANHSPQMLRILGCTGG